MTEREPSNCGARRRRAVFVTDEIPVPGVAGHLAVNHAILEFLLRSEVEVELLMAGSRMPTPAMRLEQMSPKGRLRVTGPDVRTIGPFVTARALGAVEIAARAALDRLPPGLSAWARSRRPGMRDCDAVIGSFVDARFVHWAADEIARLRPDLVLIDTIFRAPVLREARARAFRSILISHDVFHRRHAALTARGLRISPESMSFEEEAALVGLFDGVVAIQPEEACVLERMARPGARVICTPMPAQARPRPSHVTREDGLFVFVGSDSIHNVDGMNWFLSQVWPLIAARVAGARIEICGSIERALRQHDQPGVILRGPVADLGAVLHRARCAVAPILAGSGLKIKLLDYISHGLPVVTTSIGVEGFAAAAEWPFAVSDGVDDFARVSASMAVGEGAAARERAALAYCDNYAPARVFAALAELVA